MSVSNAIRILCLVVTALGVTVTFPIPVAAQDVTVTNGLTSPVPSLPAAGPTPFQDMFSLTANGANGAHTLVGPASAESQLAITGITVANNTTRVQYITFFISEVTPGPRDSPATCSVLLAGYVTVVTVRSRETYHIPYTQPLLAPFNRGTPWCLRAYGQPAGNGPTGQSIVTVIGYMR